MSGPEFAAFAPHVRLWRDVYQPPPGDDDPELRRVGEEIAELRHRSWLVMNNEDRHRPEIRTVVDRMRALFRRHAALFEGRMALATALLWATYFFALGSIALLTSWMATLFQELGGSGVTVTTLCPGVTATGMVKGTELGNMPSMMIMDAKTVAEEGYRACMAGKPVHVAGLANELAVQWIKYQPSWLVRAVGGLLNQNRDK